MISDPVSDLLIRLKNAAAAGKKNVVIPYSRYKSSLLEVLKEENLIKDFKTVGFEPKKNLEVVLAELDDKSSLLTIKLISKPGRRVYKKSSEIALMKRGRGILIISTQSGLMSDKEAHKKGLGGEVICKIY